MLDRTLKKYNFRDLDDLSPWGIGERIIVDLNEQEVKEKEPKLKKAKTLIPKRPTEKQYSQRKKTEKNSIKVIDYQLPPLNKKTARPTEQFSSLAEPGKLIKNISGRKLQLSLSYNTLSPKQTRKIRLAGKKYEIGAQQKINRTINEQRPYVSPTNNTILLFSKNKQDILKRVLGQIQGRIKQIDPFF